MDLNGVGAALPHPFVRTFLQEVKNVEAEI